MLQWLFSKSAKREYPCEIPTTAYVTHAKAGSVWISGILQELYGPNVAERIPPEEVIARGQSEENPLREGFLYPALFLRREQLEALPVLSSAQRFVVLRDLRDTLVSLYFSVKFSHPENELVNRNRSKLQSLPEEEGLLYSVQELTRGLAKQHLSWADEGSRLLRYEDLMADTYGQLSALLTDLALPFDPERLRKVVRDHSFEARYRRKLGKADEKSHGRQGAPGDWKRHFTPKVSEAFARDFGPVLIATGYEKDDSWVSSAEVVSAST
jgi:lipopolysaccharide transport system ATP-binding protein